MSANPILADLGMTLIDQPDADEIERQIDQILQQMDAGQLSKLLRDTQGLWFRLDGPQRQAMESLADVVLYGGSAGSGKALEASTLVQTPFGPRPIGALAVGETVLAADGTPTEVVGVYPQGKKQLWRVLFSDGAAVFADGEHLWNYSIARKTWRKSGRKWKVATTEQLKQALLKGQRPLTPLCSPLGITKSYRYDMRKVDPYVLGLLLGDGYTAQSGAGAKWSFSTEDPELLAALPGDWVKDSGCSYRLRGPWRKVLMNEFARLGLTGCRSATKFVPDAYKLGTIEDRWAVLQGLMDTDGTVDSHPSFTSTSRRLALDVKWLVSSLGGRATLTSRIPICTNGARGAVPGEEAYTLYIRLPDEKEAFRLERKRALAAPPKSLKRRIVSITRAHKAEAVCIAVDHPEALYVVGPDCVVTHNTDLALGLALTQHRRTLFIRREAVQLQPAFDRMAEIIGHREGFNSQSGIWRAPEGRQVQFGGTPNVGDETKYQGNSRDLLVLDEVANQRKATVLFLMGWVRSVEPGQRCRTLMCSNPPTSAEGEWLIVFFGPWLQKNHGNPAKPGELRWFATVNGKDTEVPDARHFLPGPDGERDYDYASGPHNPLDVVEPQSRTFIPALISDNPFLMDTGYKAQLQSLPEPLRSQMLYGNFHAGRDDDVWQAIPSAWVEAAMKRWEDKRNPGTMVSMGVDVSRGGTDDSIIVRLYEDDYFGKTIRLPGHAIPDGPTLGTEVILHRRDAAPVHVDAIGVGTSVVDFLVGQDVQVEPLTGSEKVNVRDSTGVFRFKNFRTWIYWMLREALDPQNRACWIQLPPSDMLKADLCAPKFKIKDGNIIQLEPKDKVTEKLGRSPDEGDGTAMAWVRRPKRAQVQKWADEDALYTDSGGGEDGGY